MLRARASHSMRDRIWVLPRSEAAVPPSSSRKESTSTAAPARRPGPDGAGHLSPALDAGPRDGVPANQPVARKVFMMGDREGSRVPGLQRRAIQAIITALDRAGRTGR